MDSEIEKLRQRLQEYEAALEQLKMSIILAIEACDRFETHMRIRGMLVLALAVCVR